MTIYCFTNKVNNKKYVGQTIQDPQQRRREHHSAGVTGSKNAFHRALRKYGNDNFLFEVIDTATSQAELDQKEIDWIAKLECDTRNHGYNMRGGGSHGAWSDEVKRKISASKKGKKSNRVYATGEKHHSFGKKQTQATQLARIAKLGCFWDVVHPDGKTERLFNLNQFCKLHNISQGNLSHHGHTKGYKAAKVC